MITSWKTSLVGALVIIAASLAMAFGGLDKTAGGLLVTVGVGLILARDDKGGGAPPAAPAADVPKAPTVPPLPLFALAALALVGCARPLDAAVTAANIGRDVGLAAHDTIAAACVPAYKAAADKAAIAAVDAKCQPAERAYRTYAALHLAAVVAIQRAQVGAAPEAEALAAARAVAQAGGALASAVREVSK